MSIYKVLTVITFSILLGACGGNSNASKNNFELSTNHKDDHFKVGDTLKLNISQGKNTEFETVTYTLDSKSFTDNTVLKDLKLGAHTITATINANSNTTEVSKVIYINSSVAPKIYSFKIINVYPHDITSYTQGLEFHDGELYESTGQYKESKLRKVNFETGEVLKNIDLEDQYFGEGLTVLNDNLYQLTWKSNIGFVYDINTFEKTRTFNYGNSKEGWGLCNDGSKLYKSDGTERIYTLNPENLAEGDYIEVYTNNGKIASLNELEWINGKIYANIYQRNGVAIVDPTTGAVDGVVDFSSLRKKVTQHPGLDVLNGIAYNPERNTIFVTGKHWDKLFEVEISEK
ncbi:Glutamine cyclotransferase [Flavobacteriaceae bacterium MAR_2010_188]|nr:Glutamine cyclotransferase [Flavobacteriaceae bacterium MAR_2010_188]